MNPVPRVSPSRSLDSLRDQQKPLARSDSLREKMEAVQAVIQRQNEAIHGLQEQLQQTNSLQGQLEKAQAELKDQEARYKKLNDKYLESLAPPPRIASAPSAPYSYAPQDGFDGHER